MLSGWHRQMSGVQFFASALLKAITASSMWDMNTRFAHSTAPAGDSATASTVATRGEDVRASQSTTCGKSAKLMDAGTAGPRRAFAISFSVGSRTALKVTSDDTEARHERALGRFYPRPLPEFLPQGAMKRNKSRPCVDSSTEGQGPGLRFLLGE